MKVTGGRSIARLAAVVGALGATLAAGASHAAATGAAPSGADRVVIVGVAGLRWDDVSAGRTPHLAAAARAGSTGALSVRSAPAVTCPAEGWLTLGAGGYAATRPLDATGPASGCAARSLPAPRLAAGARAVVADTWALNDRLRFDAQPGWLARRLPCVGAVGPGAAIAAADQAGRVLAYAPVVPSEPTALAAALSPCPATVVDGGTLPEGAGRDEAVQRVDRLVGRVRAAVDESTALMVLGVSESEATTARLHVAIVEGPGFGPGWLASTSTRRVPYVQLVDVAPTVLSVLGAPVPDEVAGRPFRGGGPGRPAEQADAFAALADHDLRAVHHRAAVAPFFVALGTIVAAVSGALAWSLHRHRRSGQVRHPTVAVLRNLAVALAAVPAATFLANLAPWWRAPWPTPAVAAAVVIWAAAMRGVAWAVGARYAARGTGAAAGNRTRVEVGVIAGLSLAVLVCDVVSGAHLQIDSLLGYNPLVAGRFVGLGNIAFSVLAAAAVIVATLAAHGRGRRGARLAVVAVAAPVVVVDGWPQWGADVGGVLTLVPAFVVLAMLVTGARVTAARAGAAALAGVALALTIGWLDYLRPVGSRSHFGRFVGSALDGRALDTIERKLAASIDLLFVGPHTLAAAAASVALAVVVLRPPPALRAACAAQPVLEPLLRSALVVAGVGMLVNDSIVAVPMVVTLVVGPSTLALCAEAQVVRPRATASRCPGR